MPSAEKLEKQGKLGRADSSFTYSQAPVNELDLVSMLDNIYDSRNQVMRDLRVDDGDFKEFPNLYEFSFSKRGLNAPLFSRQLYACLTLMHEICPTCSNPKYVKHIKDVPVDLQAKDFPEHFQMMEFGVCPKCKRTKLDHFKKGTMNPYNELAGLAGQRVGKSLITAVLSTYLTHKVLKLQNPSKVYGLLNTTLVGTLVALTYNAAHEQLWLPYKNFIESSEWFQQYHGMLKDVGERYGEEILKFGQTTLHYTHRDLLVYPSGPNKKTLRGKTRIFGAVDEMDFFNNDEVGEDQVKMNGVEVYKSLSNSMLTVRVAWKNNLKKGQFNLPCAYQFNISSPQSARGVLTETVNRNFESKKVYCFHLATWEMNPNIKRSDLKQEFTDNPEKADRDFGANPPLADSAFMPSPQVVAAMFGTYPNGLTYKYIQRKNQLGATRRAARIEHSRLPTDVPASIMAIDAGFSNNSFSMTIGHPLVLPNGQRRIKCVAVAEVIPVKGSITLDYAKIFTELMLPCFKLFNVKAMFADRWNSLKMLHDVEAELNIPAEQYSIKYRDFVVLRSYMEDGGFLLPRMETKVSDDLLKPDLSVYPTMFDYRPLDHLYLQACTVKDTERDVIKGTRLTDDTWRAMCLMGHWLLDEQFCTTFLVGSKKSERKGGIGAVSNMGSVQGMGSNGSFVPHDPTVALRMGSVGSMSGMSMSTLYAIASGQRASSDEPAPRQEIRTPSGKFVKPPKSLR